MKSAAAAIACALLLGSCSTNQYFAPRMQVAGWSVTGAPMAVYGLGERGALGELRIWSDGADLHDGAEGQQTLVHVGFELVNLGEGTLTLDPGDVHLQDVVGDAEGKPVTLADLAPAQVSGGTGAGRGRTSRLSLWFETPGLRPRQIQGFDVRWAIHTAPDRVLEQVTPFAPWSPPYPDYYWDGYWGWGWGWGYAPHHLCH